MKYITLEKFIEDLDLEIVYAASDIGKVNIYSSEISRPGLQMVGFFEKFAPERIQIIGSSEWLYYNGLESEDRYNSADKLLSYPIPALVFSRKLEVFPEVLELAKKYNRTILRVDLPTSQFINKMINHIDFVTAPSTTKHGVLIEVYGMGVLIIGKSGVGKSETALELVMRGHRLISDDTVEIKKIDGNSLRGESPNLTRHFMEIRGIGILDIERLYGVGAVKQFEYIDLVVELEIWEESKVYDRIGLDEDTIDILGINVPKVTIPVRTGRNIGMIVEVAARNNRQKKLGYNAAHVLNDRIMKEIEARKNLLYDNKIIKDNKE